MSKTEIIFRHCKIPTLFVMALGVVFGGSLLNAPDLHANEQSLKTLEQKTKKKSPQSVSKSAVSKSELVQSFIKAPYRFEANVGQTDSQVKYQSRGHGYDLYLTSKEAVLTLSKPAQDGSAENSNSKPTETASIRMQFVGANPTPKVTAEEKLATKSNYFIGSDKSKWHTGIANYGKVRYEEIYKGIDLVYYGNQGKLEYDFVVDAGVNPDVISLAFEGPEKISLAGNGDLLLSIGSEVVRQHKPIVYQMIEGKRKEIDSNYVLGEKVSGKKQQISFQLASYDTSKQLVIDPVLVYSSYFGATASDYFYDLALDANDNSFLTGRTAGTNFPVTTSVIGSPNAGDSMGDVYVAKLDSTGKIGSVAIIGGSARDTAYGIAVDGNGDAYVTGQTVSTDFPEVNPAFSYPTVNIDANNAFITKLSGDLSTMQYSTYYGGSAKDIGWGIAVDSLNRAYVVGETESPDLPIATYNVIGKDIFVVRMNAAGSTAEYTRVMGGFGIDNPGWSGIAVDNLFHAYITGTGSVSFSMVNPIQTTGNAILVRLDPNGVTELSTYLGGGIADYGQAVKVDAVGNVYVAGRTGFPATTSNPFPIVNATPIGPRGGEDIFVTKISPADSILYSTVLGGSGDENAVDMALSNSGEVYLTGFTKSIDFPVRAPFRSYHADDIGQDDAILVKLSSGAELAYSTYFGGNAIDRGWGIGLDSNENVYIAGRTVSSNFPVTADALQPSVVASSDGFIAKFRPSTVIFYDDFENDTLNASPNLSPASDPTDDYITLSGANDGFGNDILVENSLANFSTQALRIQKVASIGNSPIFIGNLSPAYKASVGGSINSGIVTVLWDVVPLPFQGGGSGFTALIGPGNYAAFHVNYASNGSITYQDGNGGGNPTGISFIPGDPKTIKAVVDLDNRTFDLFIGTLLVADDRPFQYDALLTGVDRFFFEIGGTTDDVYAIDNISVSHSPTEDLQPDLIVESFTHSPLNPTTLDNITFTAVVKNIGLANSPSSTMALKVGGETSPPLYAVPALAIGESFAVQRQLVLGRAAGYLNTATADINNEVIESNELNNITTDNYIVTQDTDGDGIGDNADNCPINSNPSQTDTDGDGTGDVCDTDSDNDGVPDTVDNCTSIANIGQADFNFNDLGDACEDSDYDGIMDAVDVCPSDNLNDIDTDGICVGLGFTAPMTGDQDNCPADANAGQLDTDSDNIGDACDLETGTAPPSCTGRNCTSTTDTTTNDPDEDGLSDEAEAALGTDPTVADTDGDGYNDGEDLCPLLNDTDNGDSDADGIGNPCDTDDDGDGFADTADNCPLIANDQTNTDGDAYGDICDSDIDGDGLSNEDEAVLGTDPYNPDTDGDGQNDSVDATPLGSAPQISFRLVDTGNGTDVTGSWLPQGAIVDRDGDDIVSVLDEGNSVNVVIKVTDPSGATPSINSIGLTLVSSAKAGRAIGDIETCLGDCVDDYSFANLPGTTALTSTPVCSGDSCQVTVTVHAFDFGGVATINATTTGGTVVSGSTRIPTDSDNDDVPDTIEEAYASAGLNPLNAFSLDSTGTYRDGEMDIDTSLNSDIIGDGILNVSEWRGVLLDAGLSHDPSGNCTSTGVIHQRLSLTSKNAFVRGDNYSNSCNRNTNPDVLAFSLDWRFNGGINAYENLGITLVDVTGMPSFQGPEEPPSIDIAVLTNNTTDTNTITQSGNGFIDLCGTRCAKHETKGECGIGNSTEYHTYLDRSGVKQSACNTYHLNLQHYIHNHPYVDDPNDGTGVGLAAHTGANSLNPDLDGYLDPVDNSEDVINENGSTVPDKKQGQSEDRILKNGVVDGDLYQQGWYNNSYDSTAGSAACDYFNGTQQYRCGSDFSIFDADGDGNVENPVIQDYAATVLLDPTGQNDDYETSPLEVQTHTVMHELCHAFGCTGDHTADPTDLQYQYSSNWRRGHHLGVQSASEIYIHNKTEY